MAKEPWRSGYQAFQMGKRAADCPYGPVQFPLWSQWLQGWLEAQQTVLKARRQKAAPVGKRFQGDDTPYPPISHQNRA